jgi:cytochrome c heme-lyase
MIAGAINPAKSSPREITPSLGEAREVSSIPVASPDELPKHQQTARSADGSTTWLYPSEKMFYEAMKRKVHRPADLRTVP